MSTPYYQDESVTLWHGDFREVLPALDLQADAIVTDPPYGETSLDWDAWPYGWPSFASRFSRSMWCFGSMRMFLGHRDEFDEWKLSQDIVWEKHNGSGFSTDRFKRVHEHAIHWYQGQWGDVWHETPVTLDAVKRRINGRNVPVPHTGDIGSVSYETVDGGPRFMRSVIFARSMNGRAINATEKPVEIVVPLVEYAVPPGGLVLDIFAGSGSTGVAARSTGRRAVLIEKREDQCEKTADRLSRGDQDVLDFGGVA